MVALADRTCVEVRLGVAGWPVGHSRSPAIQNAALARVGLAPRWRYQLLPIPPELFAETVAALPAAGFRGINVTIPHKEAALALADESSDRARAIGAANTLLFEDGRILAENTDAPGLLEVLPEPAAGRTALVLGAGGSARAAVWALQQAGAAEVRILNRTRERARLLAAEFSAVAVEQAAAADILVHCTSAGLGIEERGLNLLPGGADAVREFGSVIDLVYREGDTPLVSAARAGTIPVATGLDVLIAQGAIAFELFTGRTASRAAMREALGDAQ